MLKTFVCIFPTLIDVHLINSVGQIGNSFAEIAPIKPILVHYKESDFPSLKTEAKNQSLYRINDEGRFLFFEKAVLKYIIREAKNIDFLHIQQFNKADIYQVILYKLLNRKGKIFLKLDIHLPNFEKGIIYSKKKYFNSFHKFFEKIALQKIDLMAADSPIMLTEFKKKHPYTKDQLVLLSQSLNNKFLDDGFPRRKGFLEKENIILTTGRIGAADKNFEMLLETLPLLDLQDWKVIFVGEIFNDFDKKVEQLIIDYPKLKGKIELTGHVSDRLTLYEYYNRSKIFCLTSVLESFGVSYIEALYFGNYIIGTTGMTSFDHISNHELIGKKVENNNTKELATCLNHIIQNQEIIAETNSKAMEYVRSNFYWINNIEVMRRLLD